jgi:hypothetical protein
VEVFRIASAAGTRSRLQNALSPACSARHGTCHRQGGHVYLWGEKEMRLEETGVSGWAEFIQAEYWEMPGLSLNKVQMQRLWGLEAFVCDAAIDALLAARVLRRTPAGTYLSNMRD